MEQSGFFNAQKLPGGTFDRVYAAEEFAAYFSSFISNGVFAGRENELIVELAGGDVIINSGQAYINGYWYRNDSTKYLELLTDTTDSTVGIVLRLDLEARSISFDWRFLPDSDGTNLSELVPHLTRNATVWELCLAVVKITNGSGSSLWDTRSDQGLCGFVHGIASDFVVANDSAKLGGKPPSEYASAAQGAKADTAVQTETDPTVPAWAKAASKPTYTASEVGAAEESHTHPDKANDSDVMRLYDIGGNGETFQEGLRDALAGGHKAAFGSYAAEHTDSGAGNTGAYIVMEGAENCLAIAINDHNSYWVGSVGGISDTTGWSWRELLNTANTAADSAKLGGVAAGSYALKSELPPTMPLLDGIYALRNKGGVHSWLDVTDRLTDEEHFAFTIDTGATNTFSIPTSQVFPYDWLIDWGDGSALQNAYGVGASSSAGIPHTYATPCMYKITIRPKDDIDSWFRAFGFWGSGSTGANAAANKQKLIAINSTLTTAMFAKTKAVVLENTVCQHMFYGCTNLTALSYNFNLPQNITTAGDNFAHSMFRGCTGLTSLPASFNLPQNITTAGSGFVYQMFYGCTGLTSLPASFNLPQNITTAGDNFAHSMFYGCTNLTALSYNFNLPQNITTVGFSFCHSMFYGCTGLTSLPASFNLPQNIMTFGTTSFVHNLFNGCSNLVVNDIFKFPQGLSQTEVNKTSFFTSTFQNCSAVQTRTAASIIGTLPTPNSVRLTFRGSGFPDVASLPANWK